MNQKQKAVPDSEKNLALQERLAAEGRNRKTDLLTIIIFVALLFGFMAAGWILADRSFSETENRSLQQFPAFTKREPLDNLLSGAFSAEITDYLSDQFPLRDTFVEIKAGLELLLCKRENNGVTKAEDGYLIGRSDEIDRDNLDKNLESIGTFAAYCANRSIPLTLAAAPRGVDVLEEKLPSLYPTDRSDAAWTYLTQTAAKYSGSMTFVNLRDALLAEETRSEEQLMYKTDHHWTSYGAYIAYRTLGDAVGYTPKELDFFTRETAASDFRGTVWSDSGMMWEKGETMEYFRYEGDTGYSVTIPNKDLTLSGFYDRSYLSIKDKYGSFLSGNNAYTSVTMNGGVNRPRLLVVKDSFAHSVVPFLAIHYDLDIIDLRYYKDVPAELLDANQYDGVLVLVGLDVLDDTADAAKFTLLTAGLSKNN